MFAGGEGHGIMYQNVKNSFFLPFLFLDYF